MSTIRINKTKDYSIMSNYHLREKNMSLKAKGLLSVMLSLPDDWDYSVEGLVGICKENETSIKTTLTELKQFGYLVVNKLLPNQTSSGRIEYQYTVYEIPQIQENEKQEVEKQDLEILGVEILPVENPGQLNTNKLNTKELNTNNNIKENIKRKNSEVEIIDNQDLEILNHWNSLGIIKHKQISIKTQKKIKELIKGGLTIEDITIAMDRYAQMLHDDSYFFKYKWSLEEFILREKGIKEFLDNGSKWLNYINSSSGKKYVEKQAFNNMDLGEFI